MATRKQIRQAVKEGIRASFSSAFDFKPAQIYADELPAAAVYFEDGETTRDFDDDAETDARLVVEITAKNDIDIDGYLDALAAPVEQFVKDNRELSGLVDYMARAGFSYDRDAESFTGTITLAFNVKYDDED